MNRIDVEVLVIAAVATTFAALGIWAFVEMGKEHHQFMQECMNDGLKRYECKALSEGHTRYIHVRTK